MKVLITGATGFVGRRLVSKLRELVPPAEIISIGRSSGNTIQSDLQKEIPTLDQEIDVVIHLAGEPIAGSPLDRWNALKKKSILESRTMSTANLAAALNRLARPPGVYIQASAIGIFGDRGDECLTENSLPGSGFLADVCKQWELASDSISASRKVIFRMGVVLGRDGGALQKLTQVFKLGMGGTLGSGNQWMSWIAIDDLVAMICQAISDVRFRGVINAVAPGPVRQRDFAVIFSRLLRRPRLGSAPGWALKLSMGEMATLFLDSQRVESAALKVLGFQFKYDELSEVLRAYIPME